MKKDTALWKRFAENVKRQGPIAWISLAASILALIKALWLD